MIYRDPRQEAYEVATMRAGLQEYVDAHGAEITRAINPLRKPLQPGKLIQHIKAVWTWLTMGESGRKAEKCAYAATQLHKIETMEESRVFVRQLAERFNRLLRVPQAAVVLTAPPSPAPARETDASQQPPVAGAPTTLTAILGLGRIANMTEVMKTFARLTRREALEIIGAALPTAVNWKGETLHNAVIRVIERRLEQEGTFCFYSRYPDRDEGIHAVTALFESAGHPSLNGLNPEERADALRHMPRKLADLIVTHAPTHTAVARARIPLFGVTFGSGDWETMVAAAKRPSRLEDLASLALPRAAAWRAVCEKMQLEEFANRHDPKARESVAMEAVARVNLPEALLSAAGLDGIMKRAQGRVDAWRELANIVGRPDLAQRFYDEAPLQELTKAAKDHAASQGKDEPALHTAIAELLSTARGETKAREDHTLAR